MVEKGGGRTERHNLEKRRDFDFFGTAIGKFQVKRYVWRLEVWMVSRSKIMISQVC